jgi:hypothetical protein
MGMESVTILMVHRGDSFYLEPVLRQLRLFNPESRICLISDAATNHYPFVEHHDIGLYAEGMEAFAEVYVHMSSNPYGYELFCFQRWFVVRDFVRKHEGEHFLCLDSDVLMYCGVDEVFRQFMGFDFTVCHGTAPCYALFNRGSIERFCGYMYGLYTERETLDALDVLYRKIPEGGICDMTVFGWYQRDVSGHVAELTEVRELACFDEHIGVAGGFEMDRGRKRIYWVRGLPYGRIVGTDVLVRFLGLHLQGGAKHVMYRYLVDVRGVHGGSLWFRLRWRLSWNRLGVRVREVRKLIGAPATLRRVIKSKLYNIIKR